MSAEWIEAYGPWAVLLGGVVEGEVTFIAAGYAISQGYLPLVPTALVAMFGATLGDHLFFFLGRSFGARLLRAVPALRKLRAPAGRLLRRWGPAAAFAGRFAYGLRSVLPMSMGATRFPAAVFVPFNALAAVVFAAVYLGIGYFFGEAASEFLERTRGHQPWILLGIVGVGLLVWVVREWRLLHTEEPGAGDPPAE